MPLESGIGSCCTPPGNFSYEGVYFARALYLLQLYFAATLTKCFLVNINIQDLEEPRRFYGVASSCIKCSHAAPLQQMRFSACLRCCERPACVCGHLTQLHGCATKECSLDKVHAVPGQQRLCSVAQGRFAGNPIAVEAIGGAR